MASCTIAVLVWLVISACWSTFQPLGSQKNLLYIDGLNREDVNARCRDKLLAGGDYLPLVGNSGTVWGAALRGTDENSNQVYVSVGHRISLETTMKVVHKCCKYRIPEPTRQADLRSREFIRKWTKQEAGAGAGGKAKSKAAKPARKDERDRKHPPAVNGHAKAPVIASALAKLDSLGNPASPSGPLTPLSPASPVSKVAPAAAESKLPSAAPTPISWSKVVSGTARSS